MGAPSHRGDKGPALKAAADIGTGLKFAAAFVAIALATEYARQLFGGQGALLTSALGGLVGVDTTNTTMARLGAAGSVPASTVATAVLVAAAVNSVAKGVYATVIAGRAFLSLSAIAFLPPLAIAAAFAVAWSF